VGTVQGIESRKKDLPVVGSRTLFDHFVAAIEKGTEFGAHALFGRPRRDDGKQGEGQDLVEHGGGYLLDLGIVDCYSSLETLFFGCCEQRTELFRVECVFQKRLRCDANRCHKTLSGGVFGSVRDDQTISQNLRHFSKSFVDKTFIFGSKVTLAY